MTTLIAHTAGPWGAAGTTFEVEEVSSTQEHHIAKGHLAVVLGEDEIEPLPPVDEPDEPDPSKPLEIDPEGGDEPGPPADE